LQVKLLRVLQERVVQRLGSEEPMHVNVRVMAATNRDLHDEMKAERFRRDLFYRLSVVTLEVPPLSQHPEDISKLAERYLADFRVRLSSSVSSFSEEAMQALIRYPWPGNIRELINVVERSVLLCEGEQITLDDLPRTIVSGPRHAGAAKSSSALDVLFDADWRSRSWKDVRDAVISSCEQTYFVEQLSETNGNLDRTAERSGINPRSLYDLMKRHGMKKEDYRKREK
jgi:DNA-binding NtrC family response regulator